MHPFCSRWKKLKGKGHSARQSKHLKKIRLRRLENEAGSSLPKHTMTGANDIVDDEIDEAGEFLIIHTSAFTNLLNNVKCNECSTNSINLKIDDRSGLCNKLIFFCDNCETIFSESFSSPRVTSESSRRAPFLVNRKAVEATIDIGVGSVALEKFCATMSIRPMTSRSFQQHLNTISNEAAVLEEEVLAEARQLVRKEYIKNDPSLANKKVIDIAVSYDGTWQKRGHTSLYGVGIAIDLQTNLVVDFEIQSKYCHNCLTTATQLGEESPEFNIWFEGHKNSGECNINYAGASGGMEVAAAATIWKRSIEKNNFRYLTLLSDGDSRTFLHLNQISPYGSAISIVKEECVNHVNKRLGKGLRELAQKQSLGGRKEGALTANKIDLLCKYYRRAIVNNLEDIDKMQASIKASLLHCASTDDKPMHNLCPEGELSWCFHNRATALNQIPHSHKRMLVKLSDKVLKAIEPLYDRLSQRSLLERCTRGRTQNANESLHSLIWRKCSKSLFTSRRRIHLAVVNAVSERNNGILKTKELKAAIKNQRLSAVSEKVFTRQDQLRQKKVCDQEEYRHSKRLKKCVASTGTGKKSEDYCSGAF